uniref:Tankyrase 1-binding protein C-terminal domain-containing protein n=1 Tax=Cyprinus carpio TaxID=7962 RepID=A0A8C2L5K9_CYPCA
MAAWVEASTREMGQSLINPDKPSVSASALPGDTGKTALGPKSHLMPKPFVLQRNATIRPIRAPKTNFSRELNRATSSEMLFDITKPDTEPTKTLISSTNQTGLNSKPGVTFEDVKDVQLRSRAKSLGSQEQKILSQKVQGEAAKTDADVKMSSKCWPPRNRLSVELTSKFESLSPPEKSWPPHSPSESSSSKPLMEKGETGDEEVIGGSIKRRISLLFDRSTAARCRDTFNKRDNPQAEISVDIKQRIQNLSLDAPRTRLPSTGAHKSPPSEKTQSTSDEPPNERSSEKPAATEKVTGDKAASTTEIKNSAASVENVEEEEDHVAIPVYQRVGMSLDEEKKRREEEEKQRKDEQLEQERQQRERERLLEEERKQERKQEEEKQRQMEERRKQEEERLRRIEEERKEEERRRQAEKERERQIEEEKRRIQEEKERLREEERLEKLKKEKEMEERKQMEEERLKEEERLRQEQEKERLQKEKEMEEERRRIQEMERQKEEERLRQEREKERLRKEKEMEEEKQRIQEMERQKEEERLRQEREKERLRKEKEMREEKQRIQEMERQKEEERLRQEREKERLQKEKEMKEEKQRIQEMERQKEEERLRKEQEKERIRKEKEMEEEKRRIQEMERQKEKERLRQKREKERLQKEKEMEEERRRIQEMERQKEEERVRQEREKERLRKEKEMEEEKQRIQMERQKEEERLRQEREKERLQKEKEMEEERRRIQEMERQKAEEKLRQEREIERLKKEKVKEEERQRIQELERLKEEERLRKERDYEMEMETCKAAERSREEVPTSYDLISFDAEEPAASQTLVSTVQAADVPPLLTEVIYDDFSVKPRRWGTRARRSSTPSPSREPPAAPDHSLQPESNSSDPGSQEPCGDQVYVHDLMGFEPEASSPQNLTESRKQTYLFEESKPEDLLEPQTQSDEGELKDGESEEDAAAEQDTENLIGETDEQNENNDTVDNHATQTKINQVLQRLTQVRQRNTSTDSDTADVPVQEEPEPLPVLETAAPLPDSSVFRSKVDLGKKRSIKRSRPSRSIRQRAALPSLTEGTHPDWRFCDSTEAKDQCSNGADSESEEEPSRDVTSSPAPSQSKRVPVFPGMDPSALMAQLKRRSGVAETVSPAEAQTPPSVPTHSPRTHTRSLGPRVLPPVDAKDSGSGSSPSWLLELKSKKRMSQPESEA